MRQNPARRAALLDAAIELLAREGSRGLTQRAVDKEAAVPLGTATNYFRNRDDLLVQTGARVYERLRPGEAELARAFAGVRDTASYAAMLRETIGRVTAFRSGYVAMLELRLEALRRPELRRLLTERVRADLDENVARHVAAGLPGDPTAVLLLHLAVNWLIVEQLTLPDVIPAGRREELIDRAVERILAPSVNPPSAPGV
ncbi:TetR family transcriptional regulator [Streptomyces sp. RS10V-4]|uniref:TetR/AcrR family transcriptional regulator n=1 Tax=Streptomyces rhizoryzae TaxID=2932493 RepID=UPI002004D6D9|nr:TetR/AcrR family transcriptional regulator [Streptomyces rhizoryzae]MCK7624827.1 TetR family transcriptional regulator [Streptomyces rhizoryzae]